MGRKEVIGINTPGWLSIFLLFPFLFWMRFFWRNRGGRLSFPFQVWQGESFAPQSLKLKIVLAFLNTVNFLGISALIIAMAGPEETQREEVHLSRGIDIMIVLDQSPSMGSLDFPPSNRFNTALGMINRFVSGRKGDSIGLVSFGTDAVLQCPLTSDYQWLLSRLDELNLRDLGDGSAIGMGLAIATLHLSGSTAKERIIMLLTDGDDNAGEIRPQAAADLAAAHGIKIYSIGIGSQGENIVEIVDRYGSISTRAKIVTEFDEEKLRNISIHTGGEYWRATSPGALESVFQTIDALETVERHVSVQVISRPLHTPFIVFGTIAIVFCFVTRRIMMGEVL